MLAKSTLLPLLAPLAAAQHDWSQYVNPFIGGEGPIPGQAFGGGDIFVGGARPFGVAKVGIDTYETNVSISTINGGWTPRGLVTGVSMMHESGTGGPAKYGIISQMPLTTIDAPVNLLDNRTYWQERVGNDSATVGYYGAKLENGVSLQVGGARHSGILQYDFPAGDKYILVDVSHFLPNEGGSNEDQYYAGGAIEIEPRGKQYTGWGAYGGGFSDSAPATTYFCGEFEQAPAEAHTFRGRNTAPVQRQHNLASDTISHPTFRIRSREDSGPLTDRVGAVFVFSNSTARTVKSRVGISFISVEKACAYKNQEIRSWNLNDTVSAAVKEWNQDVFSKIQVATDSTQNRTNLVLLYSSLYFMHLMPSDRTGENPLWDSKDSWDDFYTMWDIFRCTVSFYHLFQPTYYQSMIRALIEIWKYEGYMPDGRSGNFNGIVQGGSNADNVLADAYVKGLTGINWTEGYQAMVKDAEVTPFNTFNLVDPSNGIQQGRGALYDWIPLGYVSADKSTRAISRTIEYSANDFSLVQVAKGEAPQDVQKYLNRSANWQNIWAHNFTHKGFTGFPVPRLSTGELNVTDYNPALCGGCEWQDISYEATPFEYSFTIPHDMQTLIEFMGGNAEFERRLDYIFQPNTSEQSLGANGAGINTIMNIGNEPDFATPYEYHYLNKQAKSVNASRSLGNAYFHDATYGVPGNSDAGALNSWMLWQMLGIYPVVTQPVYLLNSPWFSDINMTINGNNTLRVTATNLDNANSYFVQSVRINGQAWNKNWFEHNDVMKNGGTIEFELGSEPTSWETGDVPPSPGHFEKPRP
ncbi:glycoside hydrolase family 92 protein [Zasmidium cellare ATCC 36951]|uniref:Glycoside hydrolase family 92 protein n=1 Tax=Zasmidium cellare ATCC 36951 TaxID=1080233 RepID=A0A6A6BXA3_ZASCE|nr:glycoside hydrolase family 92 protein [Zasmidium cellare ATCC 36951]KAF2159441.1 glycoside hydrolase family 92 protein [Zasmidium cellare ATCC 36951]